MANQVLKFGKFKGMEFNATPVWYQEWLVKQDWFNKSSDMNEQRMPQISKSWNGYSRKGEAQELAVFEWEKKQALKQDCKNGICSCCRDSKYFGM